MPYTSKSSTERCSWKKNHFCYFYISLHNLLRNCGVSKGDSEDLRKLRVTTVEYFFTNSRYITNVGSFSSHLLPSNHSLLLHALYNFTTTILGFHWVGSWGSLHLVSSLLERPSVSFNSEIINYTIISLNDSSEVSVRLTLWFDE